MGGSSEGFYVPCWQDSDQQAPPRARIFNTTSRSRHWPGMAVNVLPVHSKWPNFGDQITLREWEQIMADCGCGRSPTGKCIGWHALSEEEYQEKLKEHQEQAESEEADKE